MGAAVTELLAALNEKGELLARLNTLLREEQSCLTSLDLPGLEENQQEVNDAVERLATLSESCRSMIGALGTELGLGQGVSLTPIIGSLKGSEKGALREAQAAVAAGSQALSGTLALNRGLLEDSLAVVDGSVNFFNRLLNPGDTYGIGGSIVSRRGGSRFVCKEA